MVSVFVCLACKARFGVFSTACEHVRKNHSARPIDLIEVEEVNGHTKKS